MTTPPADPALPDPPRYWWLKRLAVGFVALMLLLVGAYHAWMAELQRRLDVELAELRERGEPTTVADLAIAPVDDDRNAALTLRQAAAAVTFTPSQKRWFKESGRPWPPSDREVAIMRSIVEANSATLAEVRRSRSQPDVDWGVPVKSPVLLMMRPYLEDVRTLSQLLADGVRLAFHDGQHPAAVAHVEDMLHLGHVIDRGPPLLMEHLFRSGVDATAFEQVREMASRLAVDGHVASGADSQVSLTAVPRSEVEGLLSHLLDETSYLQAGVRSALGERVALLDATNSLSSQLLLLKPRPLVKANLIVVLQNQNAVTSATRQSIWPEATKRWPLVRRPFQRPLAEQPGIAVASVVAPISRSTMTHFRCLMERRITAILLAMRLYAVDHGGTLPTTLEDLVPRYLPTVPLDPFAADGQPLRYNGDPTRPLVWSVGQGGRDDGGSEESPLSERASGMPVRPGPRHSQDAVYPYYREPTARTPADDEAFDIVGE